MVVEAGQTVGHYRLLHRIGGGGMGEVFIAADTRVDRRVALKFLGEAAGRGEHLARFRNKARLYAQLLHGNIARLFGFVADGRPPYLIMEYVGGPTLAQWIAGSGALGWRDKLAVFVGIADAVGYLHANGIVHRDIKPANIRLAADGRGKLLDFGIAKDRATPNMTKAGNVIGTLQYLAPEALSGKPADAKWDVWALGVVLYEMLTGHLPFAGDDLGTLISRIEACRYVAPATLAAGLPAALDRLVRRCVIADPRQRLAHGALVAEAGRSILAASETASPPSEAASAASACGRPGVMEWLRRAGWRGAV